MFYIIMLYKQTILNAKVSFLTKVDLSTRVAHSFLVIFLKFPTRIMSWPMVTGVSIKVIITPGSRKIRSSKKPPIHFKWSLTTASCRHVFYVLTAYSSSLICDYTSAMWLTNYPIVYAGFDHEILSNVLPDIPVNSPK